MLLKTEITKNLSAIAPMERSGIGATADKLGVTLIETIVALGVLILGIVSALALMSSSLSFSKTSEQSIIVVNLAREGIEIVRSIREIEGFNSSELGAGHKIAVIDDEGGLGLSDAGDYAISGCDNCSLYLFANP